MTEGPRTSTCRWPTGHCKGFIVLEASLVVKTRIYLISLAHRLRNKGRKSELYKPVNNVIDVTPP